MIKPVADTIARNKVLRILGRGPVDATFVRLLSPVERRALSRLQQAGWIEAAMSPKGSSFDLRLTYREDLRQAMVLAVAEAYGTRNDPHLEGCQCPECDPDFNIGGD